jgi:hypothetical protein
MADVDAFEPVAPNRAVISKCAGACWKNRRIEGAVLLYSFALWSCGPEWSPPAPDRGSQAGGTGASGATGGVAGDGTPSVAGGAATVGTTTGYTAGAGGTARPTTAHSGGAGGTNRASGGNAPTETGTSENTSGFDAGTDPARNQVQAGHLCERLATVECAAEAACCDGTTYNKSGGYDQCQQQMNSVCVDELLIDAISTYPAIGFDATLAEAAFTEYERKASLCDTAVVSWATSVEGFRGILKGTIAANKTCNPAQVGATTVDRAASMASCANPAQYGCLPVSLLIWTCSPRAQAGGNCFTDINCIEGAYCNNPNLDIIGALCKERKPVSSPCQAANECQSLVCKNSQCVAADRQAVFCLGQ